jgi:hypothetical protein
MNVTIVRSNIEEDLLCLRAISFARVLNSISDITCLDLCEVVLQIDRK